MEKWSISAATVVGKVPANDELRYMVALVADVFAYCPTCAELRGVVGLTVKCRDWHEICRDCGIRYDQPKGKGCRRRKHPKKETNEPTG